MRIERLDDTFGFAVMTIALIKWNLALLLATRCFYETHTMQQAQAAVEEIGQRRIGSTK